MRSLRSLPLFLLLSSCVSGPPIDLSIAASTAGDQTVVFQGPGITSTKGYLFIQDTVGQVPNDPLAVIVPALTCAPNRTACAEIQFFRPTGELGLAVGVLAGQTQASFQLSDIVGHATPLVAADDGEYEAVVRLYFMQTNADGSTEEVSVLMNGFIRLSVLAAGYSPVGCGDPTVAWKVAVTPLCTAQFTTAGRSAVCGPGCKN